MIRNEYPDIILLSSKPFPFSDEHAIEITKYTNESKTILLMVRCSLGTEVGY